jgi:hypothetical protein
MGRAPLYPPSVSPLLCTPTPTTPKRGGQFDVIIFPLKMPHFKRGVNFPEIFFLKVGIVKKFFQKNLRYFKKVFL